jgi:perosamine synthetase
MIEKPIPFGNTKPTEEDIEAVLSVLRSGHLRFGTQCSETERFISSFSGSSHAVTVSSCTAGLHAALLKIGVTGKKVIVPSLTFAATANAIIHAGGLPVFGEVDERTCTLDPNHVQELIDAETVAILPVHMFGIPCDMTRLAAIAEKHSIALIEDCAYGLGSFWDRKHVGIFGDFGCFSFQVLKNVTSGEGGIVITQNAENADWLRSFRNHGMEVGPDGIKSHSFPGLNYKMTDIQAALVVSQLKRLQSILEKKRKIANLYTQLLQNAKNIQLFEFPLLAQCNYTFNVIRLHDTSITAKEVFHRMRDHRIEIQHFVPVHREPYYSVRFPQSLPCTERLTEQLIALPSHLQLAPDDIKIVVENLLDCL